MRYLKYITESTFKNWVRYTPESLKWDWEEYKKKEEYKWKDRMESIVGRWPIFDNQQHLKKELDKAKIVDLDKIRDTIGWTDISNVKGLKKLVSGYKRPRDVDRILQGYNTNSKMPMPIILKGKHGYWPLAGNTRQNTAHMLNIPVKVLVVEV